MVPLFDYLINAYRGKWTPNTDTLTINGLNIL